MAKCERCGQDHKENGSGYCRRCDMEAREKLAERDYAARVRQEMERLIEERMQMEAGIALQIVAEVLGDK